MRIAANRHGPLGVLLVLALLAASSAGATVYASRIDGTLTLTNDLNAIPDAQRAAAKAFAAEKRAAKALAGETTPSPGPSLNRGPVEAYERGLNQGLRIWRHRATNKPDLGRQMFAALSERARDRQPPGLTVGYVSRPPVLVAHAGFIGPCSVGLPCGGFGYACGSSWGRFVPHSHFFPGALGPRTGLFFPRGHFSQNNGFIAGHGFIVP